MERKKGKEKSDEKGKEREKIYKGTEEEARKKGKEKRKVILMGYGKDMGTKGKGTWKGKGEEREKRI